MDASIRITAIVDQAVKALRQVKAEAAGVEAAGRPSGKAPFSDVGAGAKDAAAQTKAAREEAARLRVEQKAAEAEAKKIADAAKQRAREQTALANEAAKAQRNATNQARQLAPQLTDIVVGLSTGQSPFTVLLQQGGQLKDVFGGVGNAGRALFSIFTLGRVVVGGLAAAFGTVAFQALQGRLEGDALNKSIVLTGNIAGTTQGKIDAQARALAASQRAAIGDVREALAALVATGSFTSTSLDSAGRAAVALSKVTGQSAAETVKQFDGMSSGVSAWAAKSNQAYNFLTVAQFKYIQSLEAQGRSQEAMRVTLDALATAMEQRSGPAVGTLEKAWNKLKETLSSVVDRLKDIGREETAESKLNGLLAKMTELDAKREKLLTRKDRTGQLELANTDAARAQVQAAIDAAAEVERLARRSADRQGEAAAAEQKKIAQEAKGFQDSLSAITSAGSQKRLAQELAALDKRQAGLERQNSLGLLSAADYSAKLNQIEQQRLVAQAANVQRQIAIESGKRITNPAETNARDAAVKGLEAQLVEVQGRIAAAAVKAEGDAGQIALEEARSKAQDWAQVWQQAADKVRSLATQNAATQASSIADPLAKATAEAALQLAGLQAEIDVLRRSLELQLNLTLDPGQRQALQAQLADLARESSKAIEDATRTATLSSLQAQFADLNQSLLLQEQRLAIAVDQGALSAVEAEQRKFAARARSLPQLQAILDRMQEIAQTGGEKNATEAAAQNVLQLRDATTDFQRSAKSAASSSFGAQLRDISTGAKTAKQGLLDMVSSFASSMADLLSKRLGDKLANQFIDAAADFAKQQQTSSGGGTGGGFWSQVVTAIVGLFHTGGVVGAGGGASRSVSPMVFAGAPRYHNEGIAGLRPREKPAILLEGEEVLTEENPRHIKNYRGGGSGGVQISTTINGAQGSETDQTQAAAELHDRMTAVIEEWSGRQRRQGGILAAR